MPRGTCSCTAACRRKRDCSCDRRACKPAAELPENCALLVNRRYRHYTVLIADLLRLIALAVVSSILGTVSVAIVGVTSLSVASVQVVFPVALAVSHLIIRSIVGARPDPKACLAICRSGELLLGIPKTGHTINNRVAQFCSDSKWYKA